MKFTALFLSVILGIAAVAQKPMDRGIHKRKTGGVSFLFGNGANSAEGRAEANAVGELVALETLSPVALTLPNRSRQLLVRPGHMERFCKANATRQSTDLHCRMSFLPLCRVQPLVGPALDQRLFRRTTPSISRSKPNSDSVDWVSLLAMLLATLGLVATGFVMGWWGGFLKGADTLALWFLSLGFLLGFLGLRRTRRGKRRGGILALVSFIVGAILPSTAIILLIALLTGNFSIPF